MKGLIVIDGCDGTGKTTLAKAICDRFDGVYIHNTYRWPTKMPLYHTAALHRALKLARTQLVVIDRLWMSEAIYADVYRGGSPWPHMGRMMDRMIRKVGGVYILAQSPANHGEKFEQLKTEREEMYDNVDDVRKRFDQLFEGGLSGHDRDYVQQLSVFGMRRRDDVLPYRFDVEGRDIDVYIDMVYSVLESRWLKQYEPALHLHTQNFAGHLHEANIIFVGDKANSKMRAVSWPFYDFGNCSEFFVDVLHELTFDETKAVYINAHDANGPMYVNDCLRAKPFMKVVCFGNDAYETMSAFTRRIHKVMHPSFAKRFNKRAEFKHELEEVING
jgi:thymidylate kinase